MAHASKFVTGARIFLFTFLSALLAFAMTLFLSIVVLFVTSIAEHHMLDLSVAYRRIAPGAGIIVFVVALITSARFELRQYRRERHEEVSDAI